MNYEALFGLHTIRLGGVACLIVPDIAIRKRLPAMQKQTKALRVV